MPKKIGNNTVPIAVGWNYLITPGGASQQWVEVIAIIRGIVYVKGLDRTIADWALPDWHFDDVIVEYEVGGRYLSTEDGLFFIASELGVPIALE